MTDEAKIQAAARALLAAHAACEAFAPLPAELRPRDLAAAYRIQQAFQILLTRSGRGPIAGHKIALTSAAMQQMVGIDRPCAGAILAETLHTSPAELSNDDFVHLGVECEIAVRLGRTLSAAAAPHDRDSVAEAVAECLPSFELVEDRNADYQALDAPSLIADNCWNAGVVLGQASGDWRSLDLAAAPAGLAVNGAVVDRGRSGDAMGHPFEAVAWLANLLSGSGTELEHGMIVMTGSVMTTKFPAAGDAFVFTVEGLGEAALTLVD